MFVSNSFANTSTVRAIAGTRQEQAERIIADYMGESKMQKIRRNMRHARFETGEMVHTETSVRIVNVGPSGIKRLSKKCNAEKNRQRRMENWQRRAENNSAANARKTK